MRELYLFLLLFILFSSKAKAQTTLAAGDIAFTGYNCDDNTTNGATTNDDICFILLRNITAGTVIFFTDFGWRGDAAAFQSANPCGASTGAVSDGILRWTATANMSYGTQINIRCRTGLSASSGSVTGIQATANLATDYLSLASGGDQVFAYQGTYASPVLLAGISANGSWDATLTNCTLTSSMSVLPAALSTNNYAVAITPEVDNARLKTSVQLTGNASTDIAAIHNSANWDVNDATTFTLPPNIIFLPVKFTYVRLMATAAILEWGVAEESNVRNYTVQYSKEGAAFSDLASIAASGRSNYSWAIPLLKEGYYRVRSNDYDGKQLFSSIVRFFQRSHAVASIAVQTNPYCLRFDHIPSGKYRVTILTAAGASIKQLDIYHTGGSSVYELPVNSNTAKGIYIVNVVGEQFRTTQKFPVN